MNKTVICVLAALATSPLSWASETEEWLGLDKELESLRSTMAAQNGGDALGITGFVRSSFVYNDDLNVAGFSIDNVRLDFNASVEDIDIVVQYEAGSGLFNTGFPGLPVVIGPAVVEGVLDAYGSWNVTDQFTVTAGQFRPAMLHFARNMEEDGNFFTQRSVSERIWAGRDQGVEVSGNFEQFGFWGGVQNGSDGTTEKVAAYGRVEFVSGEGIGQVQGAMNSSDDIQFQVGGSVYNDDALADGTAWAVDAAATMGMFALWGDVTGYDKSQTASGSTETTFSVAGSVMFVPETWEVGVRWEGLQDLFGAGNDDNIITIGLNYYLAGHSAKFQLDYAIFRTDVTGGDTETLTVGTTLGW